MDAEEGWQLSQHTAVDVEVDVLLQGARHAQRAAAPGQQLRRIAREQAFHATAEQDVDTQLVLRRERLLEVVGVGSDRDPVITAQQVTEPLHHGRIAIGDVATPVRKTPSVAGHRCHLGPECAARCRHEQVQADFQIDGFVSGDEEVRGVSLQGVQAGQRMDGTRQFRLGERFADRLTPRVEVHGRLAALQQQEAEVDLPERMGRGATRIRVRSWAER